MIVTMMYILILSAFHVPTTPAVPVCLDHIMGLNMVLRLSTVPEQDPVHLVTVKNHKRSDEDGLLGKLRMVWMVSPSQATTSAAGTRESECSLSEVVSR